MRAASARTCCTVAEIGQQLADDLAERDGEFDRVHFVGHSLGTVIIRWVLAQNSNEERVGRVVMLAPPIEETAPEPPTDEPSAPEPAAPEPAAAAAAALLRKWSAWFIGHAFYVFSDRHDLHRCGYAIAAG